MLNNASIITVEEAYFGQRLDNFLIARLKGLPKSCLYRLLRQRKIRVNKKSQKPSYRIQTSDSISLPKLRLSDTTPLAIPSNTLIETLKSAILFENSAFLIINKPNGLPVHGGSGITLGLIESLRKIYPTLPHLSLAHRLDRDTSGCLIIAKKPASLKVLHTLFRDKKIKKTYRLLVKGHWPRTLTQIDQPLKKQQLLSQERVVKVHPEGQMACTHYSVRKHFKTASLIEAKPLTGRTHQIRVHSQHAGYPIAGDDKYGDKMFNRYISERGLKRLFLHAYQLCFTYPNTKEIIRVCAPIPDILESILLADI